MGQGLAAGQARSETMISGYTKPGSCGPAARAYHGEEIPVHIQQNAMTKRKSLRLVFSREVLATYTRDSQD